MGRRLPSRSGRLRTANVTWVEAEGEGKSEIKRSFSLDSRFTYSFTFLMGRLRESRFSLLARTEQGETMGRGDEFR